MAFADWKKRSELLSNAKRNLQGYKSSEIERACAAAYKAGVRDGRSQGDVSINSLEPLPIVIKNA